MEDFVPHEVAVKLKQKGFPLTEVWRQNGNPIMYELPFDNPKWMDCKAWYIPTISQVMKWLREEKKIYVGISYMPKIIGEDGVMDDFLLSNVSKN